MRIILTSENHLCVDTVNNAKMPHTSPPLFTIQIKDSPHLSSWHGFSYLGVPRCWSLHKRLLPSWTGGVVKPLEDSAWVSIPHIFCWILIKTFSFESLIKRDWFKQYFTLFKHLLVGKLHEGYCMCLLLSSEKNRSALTETNDAVKCKSVVNKNLK